MRRNAGWSDRRNHALLCVYWWSRHSAPFHGRIRPISFSVSWCLRHPPPQSHLPSSPHLQRIDGVTIVRKSFDARKEVRGWKRPEPVFSYVVDVTDDALNAAYSNAAGSPLER